MQRLVKLLKFLLPITLSVVTVQADTRAQTTIKKDIDLMPFSLYINNIKSEKGGQLIVFVFLEDGFPKVHEQTLLKFTSPIDTNQMTMQIKIPRKADFAIKVLHDENMDGKVTKNWTGIFPKDGLGFSNGAKISFGPPSFNDAKVNIKDGLSSNISILY